MILMCVQSGVHNHTYFSELNEHLNHRCCQTLVPDLVAFRHCWLCPAENVLYSSQYRNLQARGVDDGSAQRDVLGLTSRYGVLFCYLDQDRQLLTHDCACAL